MSLSPPTRYRLRWDILRFYRLEMCCRNKTKLLTSSTSLQATEMKSKYTIDLNGKPKKKSMRTVFGSQHRLFFFFCSISSRLFPIGYAFIPSSKHKTPWLSCKSNESMYNAFAYVCVLHVQFMWLTKFENCSIDLLNWSKGPLHH